MNEVEVMQAAGHHPNLVHFLGWYRDPQDGLLCLAMGLCQGGTLSKLLKVSFTSKTRQSIVLSHVPFHSPILASSTLLPSFYLRSTLSRQGRPDDVLREDPQAHFPEEVIMSWFCQLLLALHHLHNRHILHRHG